MSAPAEEGKKGGEGEEGKGGEEEDKETCCEKFAKCIMVTCKVNLINLKPSIFICLFSQ
jgi:hypothetical protein